MEREKEALREWAKVYDQDGFVQKRQESYWLKRGDQTYLREWDFEDIPEVQLLLDHLELSRNKPEVFKEIQKTVLVSVMKGRQEKQEIGVVKQKENLSLPEYIYVF